MSECKKCFGRVVGAALLVVVAQRFAAEPNVHAAIVPWAIDSLQSSVTLDFPDKLAVVGGTPITIHVANQSGAGSTWNDGNSSPLAGTVLTDYTPSTIQFLPGGSNLSALPAGSYRPDPLGFISPNYTTVGAASANFGGKVQDATFSLELMYFALNNLTYDIGSSPLPLVSNVFSTTGVNFGMSSGTALADGVSNPFGPISDTLMPLVPTGGFAGPSVGTINSGVMTLTFDLHIAIDFGNGIVLSADPSGDDGNPSPLDDPPAMEGMMSVQLVAYQVPEPPAQLLAMLLGGFAVAALATGRRRRRCPA